MFRSIALLFPQFVSTKSMDGQRALTVRALGGNKLWKLQLLIYYTCIYNVYGVSIETNKQTRLEWGYRVHNRDGIS